MDQNSQSLGPMVLSQVADGRIGSAEAAMVLGMRIRQLQRLLLRFRKENTKGRVVKIRTTPPA